MKRKLLFLIATLLSVTNFASENIPSSGNDVIYTSSTTIYDMGGEDGNITLGADGSMTIYPETPGDIVAVMVEFLDIGFFHDYLYIYDGNSTNAPLIGTYQGSITFSSIRDFREHYGTSGAITIRYVSWEYGNDNDEGFKIRVQTFSPENAINAMPNQTTTVFTCDSYIYDNGGIYDDYQNNTQDNFRIYPNEPNKRIQITFEHIALHNLYSSSHDWLMLGNGYYANGDPYYGLSVSGYNDNTSIVTRYNDSEDGSFSFSFDSDDENTSQGYRARVTCIDDPSVIEPSIVNIPQNGDLNITSCGATVFDNGMDNNYFPSSSGYIIITPEIEGKKVQLYFIDFNVADGDYLEVYDGATLNSPLLARFSGDTIPPHITASNTNNSGILLVKFTSNSDTEAEGFLIETACVDPLEEILFSVNEDIQVTTCSNFIVDDGGVDGNYSDNMSSSLLITPSIQAEMASVRFTEFNLSSGDTLFVYNGGDANAELIDALSGSTRPNDIIANNSSGELFFEFITDEVDNSTGFVFESACYAVPLNGIKMPEDGVVEYTVSDTLVYDNGGYADYLSNSDCSVILVPDGENTAISISLLELDMDATDSILVYNGNTQNELIEVIHGNYSNNEDIVSTHETGILTLRFMSDNIQEGLGFIIQTTCVDRPEYTSINIPASGDTSISSCASIIYDDGGASGYFTSFADGNIVIYPTDPSLAVGVNLVEFNSSYFDFLEIYNGVDMTDTIGIYRGEDTIFDNIYSSHLSGALTIRFKTWYGTSYNTSLSDGFKLRTTCIDNPAYNPDIVGVDEIRACDSYTWMDSITYTESNNSAMYVFQGDNGEDSILLLDLTIGHPEISVDTIFACEQFEWIDGNIYSESNDTSIYTYINDVGCNCTRTLNLSIRNNSYGDTSAIECGSFEWYGNVYSESGIYTHTLLNNVGCDSIVTLDLIVLSSSIGTDEIITCDSYEWIDGITYTESNNSASYTLENSVGCDSIVSLNLTINQSSIGDSVAVACERFNWYGIEYTESNMVTHTFTSLHGCDSIVTLDLTINNATSGIDTVVEYNSFTWIDGNIYTENTVGALYTIENSVGCDSIITLDLQIINTLELDSLVLIAEELLENSVVGTGTGEYSQLMYDNLLAVLESIIINSNTQLEINQSTELLQSAINEFIPEETTIVNNNSAGKVGIYPNPNNGVFTVVANGITKIEVVSSLGEIVKFADVSADKYQVNMQYNAKGIYSVHITTGSKTIVRKVIVE